jgi:hypothetical protein
MGKRWICNTKSAMYATFRYQKKSSQIDCFFYTRTGSTAPTAQVAPCV